MTTMVHGSATPGSTPLQRLRWLLSDVLMSTPGLRSLALVSTDGLPLVTADEDCPSDQLATLAAGLNGLSSGLSTLLEFGGLKRTVITLDDGTLILMSVDETACLTAYTSADCDLSVAAYQLARLVERAGHVLTTQLRDELRGTPGQEAHR
ncbi:roadblock/LC7 domain-containing protein [Streptacidiphilus sp. N1-12]|uniref:Roadblock/LC7 domain-containing protein n=2 Tax=Streptacidiphilus alkalitolerans TaxID=3342712 RepID=A0ABV6VC33_9ACTN